MSSSTLRFSCVFRTPWLFLACASLILGCCLTAAPAAAQPHPIRGLPFTRLYSIDEIGKVSRGARLSFDHFGRLAVIDKGGYFVLNDAAWLDLAERDFTGESMLNVVEDGRGHSFYGALGSWGQVDYTPTGLMHPRSLAPASAPAWVKDTNFTDIIFTKDGVYFSGFHGIVFWNPTTRQNVFIEAPAVIQTFVLGNRAYTSTRTHSLGFVDVQSGTVRPMAINLAPEIVLEQCAPLDEQHVLLSTNDNRLISFDGEHIAPWPNELGSPLPGRITGIQRLSDGSLAVAVTGSGLYVFSQTGKLRFSLTSPEYHRITYLASREPGVLWAATENGVEKILYDRPVSLFGQRLGLPISWPQLAQWNDRVVVISSGRLYAQSKTSEEIHTHFELIPEPKEVWGLAASGSRLLVANSYGIFAPNPDGHFDSVLSGVSVDRLVMQTPDLCFFIGSSEIGALQWKNDRWVECAPRVPGLGYPSNVLATRKAAWIELGANRAARISYKNGQLQTRLFENFPWREPHWINVSVIGSIVILNSMPEGRIYFDEDTERLCEAPELDQIFKQAPAVIARVYRDRQGVLWAAHDRGVMLIKRVNDHYEFDTQTFDIVNERWPMIHFLNGNDVWFSTGQSLYHVDQREATARTSHLEPILVSVLDEASHRNVSKQWSSPNRVVHFPYLSNSISFRFFAGTYLSRLSPTYEFRLLGSAHSNWTAYSSGSPLTLTDLREGAYQLDVRMSFNGSVVGDPLTLAFIIDPPWYRTWYAYILYIVGGLGAIFSLVQWFVHRTRAHNVILEQLVMKRTDELRSAMDKLSQETKTAAILAERGRLAGEIHDSLQQGLSGLILQLDATLKMPGLTPEVRSRLNTARSMVSFSRHEVQNAIWDLESPLLEGGELTQALEKLITLINLGSVRVELEIGGQPRNLSQSIQHHLLRMAQEALTNAVRHAEATLIRIKLVYKEHHVELMVEDDGKGFDTTKVFSKGLGHFGLRGLKVRADKIGAELNVISAPGQGTRLRILVALAESNLSETYATGHPN